MRWLADRDPELARVFAQIEVEELEHLSFAEAGESGPETPLDGLIGTVTEGLIWLSTRGGSAAVAAARG